MPSCSELSPELRKQFIEQFSSQSSCYTVLSLVCKASAGRQSRAPRVPYIAVQFSDLLPSSFGSVLHMHRLTSETWIAFDSFIRILSIPEFSPTFSSSQGSFFLVLLANYVGFLMEFQVFLLLLLLHCNSMTGVGRWEIPEKKTDLKKKRIKKNRHCLLFPTHWLHRCPVPQPSDSKSRVFQGPLVVCVCCTVLGLLNHSL